MGRRTASSVSTETAQVFREDRNVGGALYCLPRNRCRTPWAATPFPGIISPPLVGGGEPDAFLPFSPLPWGEGRKEGETLVPFSIISPPLVGGAGGGGR